MARKGWVLLWHKLGDNPMWLEETFTRGQAWVDLILLARGHDDDAPGAVYCSKLYLMRRWRWSHNKVDRFLKRLESDGMVFGLKSGKQNGQQNGQCQKPLLTIAKYGSYQTHKRNDGQWNGQQNGQQNGLKNGDKERRTESARLADAGAAGQGKVSEIPEKFRGMFDSVEEFEEWRARNA